MASVKVGERVGAISHKDNGKVFLFGYGTYEGEHRFEGPGVFGTADEIERDVRAEATEINKRAAEEKSDFRLSDDDVQRTVDKMTINPKIKLDNGDVVYGCQCWWGPEDKIKEAIGDQEVILVPVPLKAAVAQLEERDSPKV